MRPTWSSDCSRTHSEWKVFENVYLNSSVKNCGCFEFLIAFLSHKLFCALY